MTSDTRTESVDELRDQVEQLRQTLSDLEFRVHEQNRNALLVKMAASIAHEISQPLTVLVSNVDLFKMRNPDADEKTQQVIQRLSNATQTISETLRRAQTHFRSGDNPTDILPGFLEREIQLGIIIRDDELRQKVLGFLNDHELHIDCKELNPDELSIESVKQLDVDILLVDHSSCEGKCIKFLDSSEIKELKFPFVLLTEPGAERAIIPAMNNGVTDFLPKSILTRANLGRLISYSLERHAIEMQIRSFQKKQSE